MFDVVDDEPEGFIMYKYEPVTSIMGGFMCYKIRVQFCTRVLYLIKPSCKIRGALIEIMPLRKAMGIISLIFSNLMNDASCIATIMSLLAAVLSYYNTKKKKRDKNRF